VTSFLVVGVLATNEDLAQRDATNMQWQRVLSVSSNKIGDALMMLRYGPAALKAYRAGLEIRETLTKHDPTNIQW
jgi:hypothetical protein